MTLKRPAGRLPFRIERQAGKTLTDQVAEGLRQCILTGRFKPGETLPTKLEMAAELGVNDITVRRALAQLTAEGFVAPKPRRGILVCDRTRHAWRGHVLFASWSGPEMYYRTVLAAEVTRRLHEHRYLVTDLQMDGVQQSRDYPELRTLLDTRSVDLVLVEGGGEVDKAALPRILRQSGVPFVHVDQASLVYVGAQADIVFSYADAYRALAAHCRACGLRRALLVFSGRSPNRHPLLEEAMRASGVRCVWLEAPGIAGLRLPESVERGGLAALRAWLADRPALPDLLYFDDDFIARGALLALSQRGISIPEDVQVATWANRGLGPVFDKPLTRIEMDPVAHGVAVAERVLGVLEGRSAQAAAVLEPEFVEGETTRRR